MTMSAEPITEDGAHRCLNGHRCADKVDKKARITEAANTFCASCLRKSARNVSQLPEQFLRLRHMIGDRYAGVDVNIRRPKPGGNVPLNLHIDTMLGSILTDLTTAAEVVADRMNMGDPTEVKHKQPLEVPPWADDPKQEALQQVNRCSRIVAPNLTTLITARGVGGREEDDPAIDVMAWAPNGLIHMPSTTTGIELVKRLDHLGALAHFTLGLSRARTERDTPCSRCRAKTVGRWAGSDTYDCSSCGSRFPEDELRQQDKILIELVKRGLIKPERETA